MSRRDSSKNKDDLNRQVKKKSLRKSINKGNDKVQTIEAPQPLLMPIIQAKRQTRSTQFRKKVSKGQQKMCLRRQNKKQEIDSKQKDTEPQPQRIESSSSKSLKKDKISTRLKSSLQADLTQKEKKTQMPIREIGRVPQQKKQPAKGNERMIETRQKGISHEQNSNKTINPRDKLQANESRLSKENTQTKSRYKVKINQKTPEQLHREKQIIDRFEADENAHQQQLQRIHKKNNIHLNRKGIEFGMTVPQKIFFQQLLPKGYYFKRTSKQWRDEEIENSQDSYFSEDEGRNEYSVSCEADKKVAGSYQIKKQQRPIVRTIEQMERDESDSQSSSQSKSIDWSAELKAPGDLDYLYQPDYHEHEEGENEKQSKRLSKQEKQNKKDKFLYQRQILKELRKQKLVSPFLMPVDEKRDYAPGYYNIIKNPIDLRTIETKLNTNAYVSQQQFYDDMERMWQNSFEYNHACPRMLQITTTLQRFYRSFLPNHLRYQSNEEFAQKPIDEQKEGRNNSKGEQSEVNNKFSGEGDS